MPPKHFLTSNFRVAFEEYFQSDQQRNAIDTLQEHITEVRDGTEQQRRELGVSRPQDTTPAQVEDRIAAYLDKCYWQLAQFYRYSNPCRIAEAEPALREVLRYAQARGARRDVTPELYLAVAINKIPEKQQEALSLFSSAFDHYEEHGNPAFGPRSELWARASWARLLRRVERVRDAEVQERAIVDWVVSHPLVLPPTKLRALVSDEADSGVLNNIVEHPEVQAAVEKARERKST
ncbi:hypothetical protein L227DRAFT_579064 [Lentinus tigrinus ALCF2SS1-6]|uniref:Uncharacterized protein n=1 Tax=Lentinus tigrinus ALCF2SS1-6 TaxID=1328759 RepID=A0A5C2RYF7_9APHY|nr:hypothetical protein L227DRAFT_579064 [Lentinus tigrinus ALCF2SS1-6]